LSSWRLAKQLGVGNTAVREALFELERAGLVTRIPNKGSFITKMTMEDAQQISVSERNSKVWPLNWLRSTFRPATSTSCRAWWTPLKTAAETSDIERFYQSDLEFHRTLWQLSGNRYLASSLETIVVPLFAFFLIRTRMDYRIDLLGSAERHRRLLDTIRNRDRVRDRMTASLDSSEFFWSRQDTRWPVRRRVNSVFPPKSRCFSRRDVGRAMKGSGYFRSPKCTASGTPGSSSN